MYFPLSMGIFQPAMLAYQRVLRSHWIHFSSFEKFHSFPRNLFPESLIGISLGSLLFYVARRKKPVNSLPFQETIAPESHRAQWDTANFANKPPQISRQKTVKDVCSLFPKYSPILPFISHIYIYSRYMVVYIVRVPKGTHIFPLV